MWSFKDKDGNIRSLDGKYCNGQTCFICGQHIKTGEKYAIIIAPIEFRNHKKLKKNLVAHTEEWNKFSNGIITDMDMNEKILSHKTPRKKPFSEEEQEKIKCFEKACYDYNFKEVYNKSYGLKCKQRGSSCYVEYNVFTNKIEVGFRGKRGLFDSFYERQIIANVYNRMHEYLGDSKRDEYNYKKSIQELNENVEKTLKEIF